MSAQHVGVLGSGQVGQVLASGFIKHGYEVKIGSREPGKLAEWLAGADASGSVGSFEEAADFGEIVVVAVLGRAAEALVSGLGERLAGKVVIDATNPIAAGPPVGGVLPFFTEQNSSLLERLQAAAPEAHFVKAFSCVGNPFFVNPVFPGGPPTMFIAGNDRAAKGTVTGILEQFGWDAADMGGAEGARAIEPLCMLWCIPGLRENSWTHAFRLLRL